MRIGIPAETAGETLVAATPRTAAQLTTLGYEVVVQAGAGDGANLADTAYEQAGATIGSADDAWTADVVLRVNEPSPDEIARMTSGATVIGRMNPSDHPDLIDALKRNDVTGLCLDAIPRISRAQSMDVLSTVSNIAGYRAVIEAAEAYGGMFAGQVTAAGKTARPRSSSSAPASPGSPQSERLSAWARTSGRSTSDRRSPSRSSRWAPRS